MLDLWLCVNTRHVLVRKSFNAPMFPSKYMDHMSSTLRRALAKWSQTIEGGTTYLPSVLDNDARRGVPSTSLTVSNSPRTRRNVSFRLKSRLSCTPRGYKPDDARTRDVGEEALSFPGKHVSVRVKSNLERQESNLRPRTCAHTLPAELRSRLLL